MWLPSKSLFDDLKPRRAFFRLQRIYKMRQALAAIRKSSTMKGHELESYVELKGTLNDYLNRES